MDFVAHNLCCRAGGRTLFHALNFTLASGDALCVRGANGSGKTTLLRAIAGLIPFAKGRVLWQGQPRPPSPDAAWRSRIRYVGHLDALKPEWTVWESLRAAVRLQALPWQDRAALAALKSMGLQRLRDRAVHTLSAGQKRRLALSRLALSPAPLWLLDEPTTALDDTGIGHLHALIAAHRQTGGMVLIATHHDLALPHASDLVLGAPRMEIS